MKTINRYQNQIVFRTIRMLGVVVLMFIATSASFAQEETAEKKVSKPQRPAFESSWFIENQTDKVNNKGTLEMVMQHRFGYVNGGNKDLIGIYGPSNIRIGFSYAPIKDLNLGFGYIKDNQTLDIFAKYSIIKQNRSGSIPVSVTYYGNTSVNNRADTLKYASSANRLSYFNEVIVTKRFNSKLSLQLSGNFSHYNAVEGIQDPLEPVLNPVMENDSWGVSMLGRYKVTSQTAIIAAYGQPLTSHPDEKRDAKPALSFGIEMATSSHAFQVFLTNTKGLLSQENYMFNQNEIGDLLIGFNITRLWNF